MDPWGIGALAFLLWCLLSFPAGMLLGRCLRYGRTGPPPLLWIPGQRRWDSSGATPSRAPSRPPRTVSRVRRAVTATGLVAGVSIMSMGAAAAVQSSLQLTAPPAVSRVLDILTPFDGIVAALPAQTSSDVSARAGGSSAPAGAGVWRTEAVATGQQVPHVLLPGAAPALAGAPSDAGPRGPYQAPAAGSDALSGADGAPAASVLAGDPGAAAGPRGADGRGAVDGGRGPGHEGGGRGHGGGSGAGGSAAVPDAAGSPPAAAAAPQPADTEAPSAASPDGAGAVEVPVEVPVEAATPVHTGAPPNTGRPDHAGRPEHAGRPDHAGRPVRDTPTTESDAPVQTTASGTSVETQVVQETPAAPVTAEEGVGEVEVLDAGGE